MHRISHDTSTSIIFHENLLYSNTGTQKFNFNIAPLKNEKYEDLKETEEAYAYLLVPFRNIYQKLD